MEILNMSFLQTQNQCTMYNAYTYSMMSYTIERSGEKKNKNQHANDLLLL